MIAVGLTMKVLGTLLALCCIVVNTTAVVFGAYTLPPLKMNESIISPNMTFMSGIESVGSAWINMSGFLYYDLMHTRKTDAVMNGVEVTYDGKLNRLYFFDYTLDSRYPLKYDPDAPAGLGSNVLPDGTIEYYPIYGALVEKSGIPDTLTGYIASRINADSIDINRKYELSAKISLPDAYESFMKPKYPWLYVVYAIPYLNAGDDAPGEVASEYVQIVAVEETIESYGKAIVRKYEIQFPYVENVYSWDVGFLFYDSVYTTLSVAELEEMYDRYYNNDDSFGENIVPNIKFGTGRSVNSGYMIYASDVSFIKTDNLADTREETHSWFNTVGTWIGNAVEQIGITVGGIRDSIVESVGNMTIAIERKFDETKTAISNKIDETKTAINNKLDDVKDGIVNAGADSPDLEIDRSALEEIRAFMDKTTKSIWDFNATITKAGDDAENYIMSGTKVWNDFYKILPIPIVALLAFGAVWIVIRKIIGR